MNLRDILHAVTGSFILSLIDVQEVRERFKNFTIEAVETTYSLAKSTTKRAGEVIVSGGS